MESGRSPTRAVCVFVFVSNNQTKNKKNKAARQQICMWFDNSFRQALLKGCIETESQLARTLSHLLLKK